MPVETEMHAGERHRTIKKTISQIIRFMPNLTFCRCVKLQNRFRGALQIDSKRKRSCKLM